MVRLPATAFDSPRRVLVAEDDYFLAASICQELEDIGVQVVGPVASVASAIEKMAANDPLEGAILDINLGGEWVYPVAGALNERHVPFVFWTGYERLQLPDTHRAATVVHKPATGSQLVTALFERIRGDAPFAAPFPLADVYVTGRGDFLLQVRRGVHLDHGDDLRWVGSTLLNRAGWSRTLRTPLRDGIFYRVPPRFVVSLRAQLTVVG